LKRGEIWTVAGGKDYAAKPRPAVIVQNDRFDATGSITICALTSDKSEAPLFRIVIQPSDQNKITTTSRLMVDKITTIPKSKLGSRIGHLDAADMARVNQAMLIILGLADSPLAAARVCDCAIASGQNSPNRDLSPCQIGIPRIPCELRRPDDFI
jgi:mRNA interferase MazF